MPGFSVTAHAQARDGIGRFLAEYNANAARAVTASAEELGRTAEAFAPKLTGELAGSITVVSHGKTATVRTDNGHAAPQEFGAGPHAIPNAFGWGEDFGTAPDFHPGNPATHFMRRAAEATKGLFVRNVRNAIP